jgi:hypothetical protein
MKRANCPVDAAGGDVETVLDQLAQEVCAYWEDGFRDYFDASGQPVDHDRPVARLVAELLALPSYEDAAARRLASAYVRQMTLQPPKGPHRCIGKRRLGIRVVRSGKPAALANGTEKRKVPFTISQLGNVMLVLVVL